MSLAAYCHANLACSLEHREGLLEIASVLVSGAQVVIAFGGFEMPLAQRR
eukprot:m.738 g.738  ORF g.738 m.738 type:complete len:50 (-) comp271_c0_seq1:32-181(-)